MTPLLSNAMFICGHCCNVWYCNITMRTHDSVKLKVKQAGLGHGPFASPIANEPTVITSRQNSDNRIININIYVLIVSLNYTWMAKTWSISDKVSHPVAHPTMNQSNLGQIPWWNSCVCKSVHIPGKCIPLTHWLAGITYRLNISIYQQIYQHWSQRYCRPIKTWVGSFQIKSFPFLKFSIYCLSTVSALITILSVDILHCVFQILFVLYSNAMVWECNNTINEV